MRHGSRIVVDTNCLISRLLLPDSTPGRAVRKAVDNAVLLVSEHTMHELADVLGRPKFDRYVSVEERVQFIRLLARVSELVTVSHPVRECRDPSDDRILEVAWNGRADLIITGDTDLLHLHPWRDIAILSPADYLKERPK